MARLCVVTSLRENAAAVAAFVFSIINDTACVHVLSSTFFRTACGVTSLLIFGPVVLLLSELSEHNCESEAMMFLYSPHLFDFGRKIAQFMI